MSKRSVSARREFARKDCGPSKTRARDAGIHSPAFRGVKDPPFRFRSDSDRKVEEIFPGGISLPGIPGCETPLRFSAKSASLFLHPLGSPGLKALCRTPDSRPPGFSRPQRSVPNTRLPTARKTAVLKNCPGGWGGRSPTFPCGPPLLSGCDFYACMGLA